MFLIFFFSGYIVIQSHSCKNLELSQFPAVSPPSPLFLDCVGFHCYSYCKWPCDGAPGTMLKRRFCLHTRAKQLSHIIPTAGDPLCWPPRHSASAARLSFTSIQITCKEAAGSTRLAGCYVAPVDWCTAYTLLCHYSTNLFSVVLSSFVSILIFMTLCVFRLMYSVCESVCAPMCSHMHPCKMYVIPFQQRLSWKPWIGLVSSCCEWLKHAGKCGNESWLIISHHVRYAATCLKSLWWLQSIFKTLSQIIFMQRQTDMSKVSQLKWWDTNEHLKYVYRRVSSLLLSHL